MNKPGVTIDTIKVVDRDDNYVMIDVTLSIMAESDFEAIAWLASTLDDSR